MVERTPIPGALQFVTELEKIGTIVFITASLDWQDNRDRLREAGLWLNDHSRILLTLESYSPMYDYPRLAHLAEANRPRELDCYEPAHDLVRRYMQVRPDLQSHLQGYLTTPEPDSLAHHPIDSIARHKHVAMLFGCEPDIPLVEDSWRNCIGNPGIIGYKLEPQLMDRTVEWWPEIKEDSLSYDQILAGIRKHYRR